MHDISEPAARLILFKINKIEIILQIKSIIRVGMWQEFLEFFVSHPIWDMQSAIIDFGMKYPNIFEIKNTLIIRQ